ncbi:AP2 domain-containing protein [Staphylococcus xylosus]
MKKLYINNANTYIIVDNEDYDSVHKHIWHVNINQGTFRILGWVNGKKVLLPYYLTGKINSYQKVKGYDFRRSNIGIDEFKYRYRIPQRNASSKYKGVRKYITNAGKQIWIASIMIKGKSIHLGCFNDEVEAAKSYNKAVIEFWNGNGYLNNVDISDLEY